MADARDIVQERIGTTLKGKWTLEKLLGTGGMAAVYSALHKIGRRDAIKILHPEVAASQDLKARFEREAEATNRFKHPGAVEIRDFDVSDDGCPFLVMEHLEGESLGERARRLGGIPESDLLVYVDELCDVLAAAHKEGIVHRDIKLDNLFITSEGKLKVLDFGIARVRSAGPALTLTGTRLGTTAYMPPEQIAGRDIDGRADLFAVGATMFRILAKRRIHEAPTDAELVVRMSTEPAPKLRTVAPEVDENLARVVDLALAFRVEDRYPNAVTMQEDVRALREGHPPPFATARLAHGGAATLGGGTFTAHEPTGVAMGAAREPTRSDGRGVGMPALGTEPTEAPRPAPPRPMTRPGLPPRPNATIAVSAAAQRPIASSGAGSNAFSSSPTAVTQAPHPIQPAAATSTTSALTTSATTTPTPVSQALTPAPAAASATVALSAFGSTPPPPSAFGGPNASPATPLSMAVPTGANPPSSPPPSMGPQSMGPQSMGPQSYAGPQSMGSHSMGPQSMGPQSMGPQSYGAPHSMGPHSMGPQSTGPQSMGPQSYAGPQSMGEMPSSMRDPRAQGVAGPAFAASVQLSGPPTVQGRKSSRGPVTAVVAVVGALLVAGVGGTIFYLNSGASESHKAAASESGDDESDSPRKKDKAAPSAAPTASAKASPTSTPQPTQEPSAAARPEVRSPSSTSAPLQPSTSPTQAAAPVHTAAPTQGPVVAQPAPQGGGASQGGASQSASQNQSKGSIVAPITPPTPVTSPTSAPTSGPGKSAGHRDENKSKGNGNGKK